MSKTNNIKQAVLDAEQLKNTIKEESKETLKSLLSETVKNVLREAIEDDEDDKENDYEVVDDETETNDAVESDDTQSEEPTEETPETEEPVEDDETEDKTEDTEDKTEDTEGETDDWSEFSQYQVGDDNTYDLTGEEDYNQIVKVYKLMNDTDQVVVKQDGSKVDLTDSETGNEYIIDLGTDSNESVDDSKDVDMTEGVIKESPEDIAGIPDAEDDEISPDDFELDTINNEPTFEGTKKQKVMKENKEMIFEVDLGYTDNYQDKDPIQGLSNTEPSKSGKSWEKGVPTGTEKPWAGDSKSKGEPFEKNVNEEQVDECGDKPMVEEPIVDENVTVVKNQKRKTPKTKSPNSGDVNAPKVSRHISVGSDYKEIAEAYKKENAELKEAVKSLKKTIQEAYVVNTNLAKITRLFTENSVSQKEKVEIIDRFTNEAKTLEQSKALYESIDKQLKKNVNLTLESVKPMNVENTKVITEEKSSYKSQDLLNTLDLIKRMQNC